MQENQNMMHNTTSVGWNNLLRSKFAKDWRNFNGEYNRKQNEHEQKTSQSHRAQEEIREAQERERDGYWDPIKAKQRKAQEVEQP